MLIQLSLTSVVSDFEWCWRQKQLGVRNNTLCGLPIIEYGKGNCQMVWQWCLDNQDE